MSTRLRFGAILALGVLAFSTNAQKAKPKKVPPSPQTLVIVEAPAPAIGTSTFGPLSVAVERPDVWLTIENSGKEDTSGTLHITIRDAAFSRFQDADIALALKSYDRIRVKFTPVLRASGTYNGSLKVTYTDHAAGPAATFQITRNAAATPTVTAEVIPSYPFDLPLRTVDKDVPVTVNLSETGGAAIDVNPILKSFVVKPDANVSLLAYATIDETRTIRVEKGAKKKEDISVRGIRAPGKYEANIAFRDIATKTDTTPVAVTIFARYNLLTALLVIFLGVFASAALRIYLTSVRPLLLSENRLALIFEALATARQGLDAEGDQQALELIKRMEERVTRRWEVLRLSGRAAGTTEFDIYDEKLLLLQTWIALRRRATEAEPIRKTYIERMNAAAKVLDRASTSAEIAESQKDLDALHTDIDAAAANKVRQEGDFGTITIDPRPAEELKHAGAAKKLRAKKKFWDAVAFAASLLLALLLGYKTLYFGNLTWGNSSDLIAALLWGFGMHTFTSGGITAILAEVKKVGD